MKISFEHYLKLSISMRATLLVALSAILYGCLGFFGTRLIALKFTIPAMLFWRFFIATLWMLPFVVKEYKKNNITSKKRSQLYKAFIFGGFCYGANSGFYFVASHTIGTGLAMVIFFTYPMFVVLLSWLVDKHRASKPMLIALLSITIGLLLLKGNQACALDKAGIFFAIIGALFYAIYVFGSKQNARNLPSCYLTLIVCAGCSCLFLLMTLFSHAFIWPTSGQAWFYIIAVGVFATALPIQLLLEGLKHINPSKVAILSVLEPVVTLIVGITALHEAATTLQLLGAAIILLSAIVIQFER